ASCCRSLLPAFRATIPIRRLPERELPMSTAAGIRWLKVLLAGFLAEVSVIAFVLPLALLFGKGTLTYTAPAFSLLACFVFAIWVGRRLTSHFVLHGILVG